MSASTTSLRRPSLGLIGLAPWRSDDCRQRPDRPRTAARRATGVRLARQGAMEQSADRATVTAALRLIPTCKLARRVMATWQPCATAGGSPCRPGTMATVDDALRPLPTHGDRKR
jgi:hypothetical protein